MNKKTKLMVNFDGGQLYSCASAYGAQADWPHEKLTEFFADSEVNKKRIREYHSFYLNQGITDVCFCLYAQGPNTPSKLDGKKYLLFKNGQVDFEKFPLSQICEPLNWNFYSDDFNPTQELFDFMKENGINSWLSLRMNDVHYWFSTQALHAEFVATARANGWVTNTDVQDGYFSKTLDYGRTEVREHMLKQVQEFCDNYDFYGLEFDFIREMYCFDYAKISNKEACETMTEFVQKVRAILDEKSKKTGNRIPLLIRAMRSPAHCKECGLDLKTWVEQGLIDCICAAPRWAANDSLIPVDEWKQLIGSYPVDFVVGLDERCHSAIIVNDEAAKGYTAQYLAAGADGIYLHNYFVPEYKRGNGIDGGEYLSSIYRYTSDEVASHKGIRRHVVSYQDYVPPISCEEIYKPLPMTITPDKVSSLDLYLGRILPADKIHVFIGCDGEMAADVKVKCSLNDVLLQEVGPTNNALGYDDELLYAVCEADEQVLDIVGVPKQKKNIFGSENTHFYEHQGVGVVSDGNIAVLTIQVEKECTLNYIEILIDSVE